MKYDFEIRVQKFSINIINKCKKIKINIFNKNIIYQLIRSSSSIGANYFEANNACSKKDFINKLYISLKEANETKYWLNILINTNNDLIPELQSYSLECSEIIKILQTIINKSK